MKFICDRPSLLDAVNVVSSVVSPRSPRPQLMCVKLRAAKSGGAGALSLAATDGEIFLSMHSPRVDVAAPGEALIPADKLRAIVAAEEGEPTLTIEVEKDVCEIRGADARFKIFGYPPADFPAPPEFPEGDAAKNAFTVNAKNLRDLIGRTTFAAARETSRYAINGVLLKRDGKKLEMVATDGRRLALARANASGGASGGASCIVPTKALGLVQKLLGDDEQEVRIAVQGNQILFAFSGGDDPNRAVLASTLVEGAFPPYEDVIPRDQDKKASFTRDTLMSGVRRAGLITNEESRGVRLTLNNERLRLSSRAPEMGEAEVDVPVDEYAGDPIEIGFNPNFITDALKVMGDSSIVIELKAPNKPGLIRSGNDFLYVVMPVNLQ